MLKNPYENNAEVNAKMQAQTACQAQQCNKNTCDAPPSEPYPSGLCGEACSEPKPYNPFSLQEEAARRAQEHYEQASKAQSAAVFFANNPAFEDFIRLVRSGAIQF
jgi:hypothetical protein